MMGIFWLTTTCNLACKYCYEGVEKKYNFMPDYIIDGALKFLFEKIINEDETLQIVLHGGEPFLAFKEMKYLVEKSSELAQEKRINIQYMTTTNATILNEEMIDFICENIKNITVSIDGDKDTHDFLRPFKNGNGTHNIVVKNLKKLLNRIPNLTVRLTYNYQTVGRLFENIKFLIELGVKCIVPARDMFDENWDLERFNLLKSELEKIKDHMVNRDDIVISILDTKNIKPLNTCGGGMTSFNFYTDGSIYPCTITVGNNEFNLGNVMDEIDLKKRDKLLSYSEEINQECIGCIFYNFCEQTRCKIINKIINGDYCKASPVSCREKHMIYQINFKK